MAKKGKGSAYEREICKLLSLWWTDNEREDVYWRSSGSGARAKVRSKSGKSTFGQYGDVSCIDPIGQPLIDNVVIEIKRGYGRNCIYDVLDKLETAAEQEWTKWLNQVLLDKENSGSPAWWLITKRDRRQAMIFYPQFVRNLIIDYNGSLSCENKKEEKFNIAEAIFITSMGRIFATTLTAFLNHVSPKVFIKTLDV